ncbi:hypothetical protein EOA28_24500 [Mesorhizobium sp. M2A.F.Ca.ET.067.02.1.1]|nr:hypothetical protein EOA28_24500 [Mesorhizobium sp. M2A.F.Ca.ET.067.02.1.1]TIU58026.1 MAG: hypothetical protein E5W35_06370 [Mesorhizobium sp.]
MNEISTTRRGFIIGAAGISLASALGLPRAAKAAQERLGFILSNYVVPRYRALDQPFFEKGVKAAGYEPVVTQSNLDVAQQLRDVENFINLGVKVLTLTAIDKKTSVNMVRKAKDAGIPVVAYNEAIPTTEISAFVGRDNRSVGRTAVQAAAKMADLQGKFVIVSGSPEDTVAEECTAGYYDELKPLIDSGKVEIVSHQFNANWDPEVARQQAENALSANGNQIKGFFCNDDGMAGGVIQALLAQGLAGKVFVSGQDATTQGCRNILKGYLTVSSFTKYDVMGTTAAEIAVKLAKGETVQAPTTYMANGKVPLPWWPIESFNVTKDNIVDYIEHYSPAYLDAKAVLKGIDDSEIPDDLRKFR